MSTHVREIKSPAAPTPAEPLTATQLQRRVILTALWSSVLLSLASTYACVLSAMAPNTPIEHLIALAIASGAEAMMAVGKHALRMDARSVHAWLFALADTATNAAGVYWVLPGLADLPGIAHGLALIGLDGQAGQVIVSLAIGFLLSIAQPFFVAMLEYFDEVYGEH